MNKFLDEPPFVTIKEKPAEGGLLGRWTNWRLLRSLNQDRLRMEREEKERGSWGYIPPGAFLVPRRAYRLTRICFLICILSDIVTFIDLWYRGALSWLFG